MMAHELDTATHKTVSNSGELTNFVPVYNDNISADIGLRIIRLGDGRFDFTLLGPLIKNADANLNGISSQKDIFAHVEICRQQWQRAVVNNKTFVETRTPKY